MLEACSSNKSKCLIEGKINLAFLFKEFSSIKREHPYFNIIHDDSSKHILFILKKEIELCYKKLNEFPKFRQSRKNFFPLHYKFLSLENKINNKTLTIPLGTYLDQNKIIQLEIETKMNSRINLRSDGEILVYEITKMYNYYYFIVCIKYCKIDFLKKTGKTIAIDPNHTNFFVSMDSTGKSMEFENLYQLKYFDVRIDSLRSKRAKCLKDSKVYSTLNGTKLYVPSKRYEQLTVILLQLFHNRNEQINTALYSIAKYLVQEYDVIAIGDYSVSTAKLQYKEMRRKMINQSVISKFRKILEYVCQRSGKQFILINEYNTTKKCFNCNHLERKNPEIRVYTCPKCKKVIYRDINSAINIGIKANILSSQDYEDLDLSKPSYTANYNLQKQKIVFCD